MRRSLAVAAMMATMMAGGAACEAQVAAGPAAAASTAATSQTTGSSGPGSAAPQAAADTRTEKQKTLARQTERLFDMATELKVQVDKTNKNILSLRVVEKAEQIEALAKGMREQAKR